MLTYSFDNNTEKLSLYEYLYKCIKDDILSGKLLPHDKLPSKRNFSKNLNISNITVENAYAQLVAEGYIYALPKKGYYVSEISNSAKNISPLPMPMNSSTELLSSKYEFDFSSNTNSQSFPFNTWAKLIREIMSSKSSALVEKSPSAGVVELRQAIAMHLYQFRGMNVSPEQVIIGAGTEYLYGLLIQLLGRDNVFGIEDPGYKKIAQIYLSNDVDCRYIPINNDGMDINLLKDSDVDIVHISPSHHFPTGIVTPISKRYELLNWAIQSTDRYIIEDDYDCEFRLLGKPIPTMQSIDTVGKVIYMNTFTKSLTSTIRISYMVLPMQLINEFNNKLGFFSNTVSNFEQYTLAKFIQDGYFEKHINRMRNYYKNQRNFILRLITSSEIADKLSIKEENSGLHFLMYLQTNISDGELIKLANDNGVRISCLSQFYHNRDIVKQHTIIVNYSGLHADTCEDAINKLLDICKKTLL